MQDKNLGQHSVAFWLRFEIHERLPNGQLKGTPKKNKDFRGGLHCESFEEAQKLMEKLGEKFKEVVNESSI